MKDKLFNIKKWINITVIFITLWNIATFYHHYYTIGITDSKFIIIHIIGMMIEYSVSGYYRRLIVFGDTKINNRYKNSFFRKTIAKTITYISVFIIIYATVYYLRLQFFSSIDWGISMLQVKKSMIFMFLFSLVAGPIMGYLVIKEKKIHLYDFAF